MKNQRFIGVAAACAMHVLIDHTTAAAVAVAPSKSEYINLDTACVVVGPKHADNEDASTSKCGKQIGGWQVFLEYGDAREDITLKRAGKSTPLDFFLFGPGFSSVGPNAEFRTRSGSAYAFVIRFSHVINPDTNEKRSDLMVAKLTPTPCVVAQILPGTNQSALARAAADKAGRLRCLRP